MEKLLRDAMQTGETWTIIYRSRMNLFSKREIKVLGINGNRVIAYCFWRQAIRTFYTENILAMEKWRDINHDCTRPWVHQVDIINVARTC
ncbi:hypothetical protein [Pseudogracilibacillus sp. ICA-222130]|uniref:hypothetical protein n=1 Tax=Pseudogracilibacillus sp. ICA-222130 TaxID=3134655 RepID=UPI0030BEF19F